MEKDTLTPYSIEEQEKFDEPQQEELRKLNLDDSVKGNVKYLGLSRSDYSVSYYIGVDWLIEKESYIAVSPKVENLDYVKMFVHCLHHPEISKHMGGTYHVDSKKPSIRIDTAKWDLTPFMIVHFLSLIDKIVKQGLKSNYIVREENLHSKIKGKIVWSQQIKKNIVAKREDRIFCRYQEYSINCYENRLLKKTLLFIQRYSKCYKDKYPELIRNQNTLLATFENISDDISLSDIKRIKINTLYNEYAEAIALAKKILHRFGYSYKKVDSTPIDNELPPFRINMARLFELYVYCLLREEYPKEITYQSHGKYGYVDFLKADEKLIIDTKYKLEYNIDTKYKLGYKDEYEGEDIGQLSGYARDTGVLKKLEIFKNGTDVVDDSVVVECVIIYPDITADAKEDFKERKLKEKEKEISQFTKFYKCGIKLPTKQG